MTLILYSLNTEVYFGKLLSKYLVLLRRFTIVIKEMENTKLKYRQLVHDTVTMSQKKKIFIFMLFRMLNTGIIKVFKNE